MLNQSVWQKEVEIILKELLKFENNVIERLMKFQNYSSKAFFLTLSRWRSLSYESQSTDLKSKSANWILYHRDLRHKNVNACLNSQTKQKSLNHCTTATESTLKQTHSFDLKNWYCRHNCIGKMFTWNDVSIYF